MTSAVWTNGNSQGRLEGGVHSIMLADALELAGAVNRRRMLTYQLPQDYSSQLFALSHVRSGPIAQALAPPFDDLRQGIIQKLLSPPVGTLGGYPPSPQSMQWLWPLAGADENKVIVSGLSGVGDGEVSLLGKINAAGNWSDAALAPGQSPVRAAHFNELRQAVESLTRGRWVMPIYIGCGIFSILPDSRWMGGIIGNNGGDECRQVCEISLQTASGGHTLGPGNVIVRPSSTIAITTDTACTVEVYRCLRDIDSANDGPTWNKFRPDAGIAWGQPGGLGAGDAELIGVLDCTSNQPAILSGQAVAAALQAMIGGQPQIVTVRRSDSGYETIAVSGELTVEFDLAGTTG